MSHTDVSMHGDQAPELRGRIPSRRRYLLAALLAVGGIVAAVALQLISGAALSGHADGFQRAIVPGELTLQVDRPATYYVYAEGTLWVHPSVRVTDPTGRGVAVEAVPSGPQYYHGGNGGAAVGKFDATLAGDYRIAVATGTAVQGDFAVGGRFPMWMRLVPDPVAWAIVVIGVGSGIVIATVTAFRRRRGQAL
jgi:hypothetical protein